MGDWETASSVSVARAAREGNAGSVAVCVQLAGGNRQRYFDQGVDMGIIAFIILGLLAGAIAKAIMPGDDPGGWIVTAIIGVVGAVLGGLLAGWLFDADPLDEFFDISSWLTAIVGSLILLWIYRLAVGRRGGSTQLR